MSVIAFDPQRPTRYDACACGGSKRSVADICRACFETRRLKGITKPCDRCGAERVWRQRCKRCRLEYGRKKYGYTPTVPAGNPAICRKCSETKISGKSCLECGKRWRKENRDKVQGYNRTQNHNRRARLVAAAGRHTEAEWQAVLANFGRRCAQCASRKNLSKDHIIPLSRGGSNYAFNLQPLCVSCNARKHTRLVAGAQFSLFDRVS